MTPDFVDLQREIKDATRTHFQQYRARFPDETAPGYSLYTDDGAASIGPVATGAADLPVGPDDPEYAYYRYGPQEWAHWDDFGLFAQVNDMCKALESRLDFHTYRTGLLDAALQALCELDAEGIFGPRDEGRYVVLWISDSDDEIMHTAAKALNCASVWHGYASAYVEVQP